MRDRKLRAGPLAVLAATSLALATLSLSIAPAARADLEAFKAALAEIDEALATNPYGASPDNLETCRAMRKTSVLLWKMGHRERAVRRLQSCRRLLGLEGYAPGSRGEPGVTWWV